MYEKLMQSLGFPDSEYLRRILEYLMDEEEARIAASLPGSIEEVAEKLGIDKEKVKEILERLFDKGVAFPKDFKHRNYFRFARDIIQLHDATMASKKMKDSEFARLWKEFGEKECNERIGQFLAATGMKVWRVIPAYKSIAGKEILPYENIRHMIQSQEKIAVVPCSCRNVSLLAGDGCNYTNEAETWHCIQLGRGAEYVIERGSGKEISVEEALELIDRIEEEGLIHTWPNTSRISGKGITVNCNCCSDCCEFFLSARAANIPIEKLLEKSRWVARVSEDLCIACETCLERCHFGAIEINEVAKIAEEKCFGCGLCVVGCEQEAIKMEPIRPPEHIPS
ncbi:MAG: (Fe-S)-binding protein [Archaeoglobus sp.]|nr:(Fe-S)-binding protein [Archaeoglobus sp.]